MAIAEVVGHVTRVERMWMLAPFQKALQKRQREIKLLEQLNECIALLFRDPTTHGLGLETIGQAGHHSLLSARITQSYRLILVPFSRTEIGLLHFDNHDEAYRWVDTHRTRIPTYLGKVQELTLDRPLLSYARPVAFPRAHDDDPIVIRAADDFHKMVAEGVARYLTYLDDEQRSLAELPVVGTLLIKGGAGTGKTAVALHRVLHLARNPPLLGPRGVLYLCYNRVLASAASQLLAALNGGEAPADVEVKTIHGWCDEFLLRIGRRPTIDQIACQQTVFRAFGQLSKEQRAALGGELGRFVDEEIVQVIKHNGLARLDAYLSFNRRGRGVGLKQAGREAVWAVHQRAHRYQEEQDICRFSDLPLLALGALDGTRREGVLSHYRAIVIDEGQDCSPVMIRLARQLLEESRGSLVVLADPAQAIYESGYQWTQLELLQSKGRNVRWLKRPYRATRELFDLARPLLDDQVESEAGQGQAETPERHGPRPRLVVERDPVELHAELAERIAREASARPPNQIGVLAGQWETLRSLAAALAERAVPYQLVDDGIPRLDEASVKLVTIHSAKGLDFPTVFLVGPSKGDLGGVRRAQSLETARALYVALTRSSESLTIGAVDGQHHPLLERLDDQCYEVEGSRGREFANLRGVSSRL